VAPLDTYAQRLQLREARASRFEKLHDRVGSARLALAAAIIVTTGLYLAQHTISVIWPLGLVAGFVALVIYHQQVRRHQLRAQRASVFYRSGIGRIQDRWAGTGQTGEKFDLPRHIYASDLDLFGKGSLYELLCVARTQMGESTLAQWLATPATIADIRERHASIRDLRDRVDLREDWVILGEQITTSPHSEALMAWAEAPNVLHERWLRWAAPLLAILAVIAVIVWALRGLALPFVIVLLIEWAVVYSLRKKLLSVVSGVEQAFEELKLLSALLNRLEREHFEAPLLQALLHKMASHNASASYTFAKLATIVSMVESRRNLAVRPFSLLLMFLPQVALAAERWRSAHGKVVRTWLSGLGEIEALVSISGYSYEHPDDPFPEFIDGPASFQATQLGHPLIPAQTCILNDVDICGDTRVLLVSGSNMSGKSTLLRTVGVNVVLAMAGAPVRAKRLQLTPLQIGASIRINDSLHEGSSRFYAEITRLRQLFELDEKGSRLLFLLDELLQGTNSKDRRVGAEGILRALLERGAIGLISTHDLALTDITGLEEGLIKNIHFQDELENGKLRFDFKLRAGVVTKSNGIELMRSIGLKV
jgi:MutS domain V